MNFRTITNCNRRQFDKMLQREGQVITDYFSGVQYNVFFRTMKHSDSTTSKVRLYYDKDYDIARGTVFTYQGETFVVINKDAMESQAYNTSVACRCSQTLLCNKTIVPFVVSELKNVFPTRGSVFSVISGAITLYSIDNYLTRSVRIDDSYSIFGGIYKVVNAFYNDGLAYIYLQRDVATYEYSVKYLGSYNFDISAGTTYELNFQAYTGDATTMDAVLTYTSSDTDVATVDANGIMTAIKEGTVTVTATWAEHNVSETVEFLIGDSSEDPTIGYTASVTHAGTDTITIGGSRKRFTVTFTDADGADVGYQQGTWKFEGKRTTTGAEFVDITSLVTITTTGLAENQVYVQIPDNSDTQNYIGGTFRATFTTETGLSANDDLTMRWS